jgi:uncharacterized protein (TIGR02145 family)
MKSSTIFILFLLMIGTGCEKDHLPPIAACAAYPLIGDTTVLFEFDASKSMNNQGFFSGLSYRWDYEDDGTWDTDWRNENSASHRFINSGRHTIIVEVADFAGVSDTASVTIETFGRNHDIASMCDSRDGKIYSIAKFRGYWWMRENLSYGQVLNPMQMQTNNGIVEQFSFVYQGTNDSVFGLYDWREAMNYDPENQQGICPPGWNIPSMREWNLLLEGLPNYYAINFYKKGGLSELNLDNGSILYGGRGPDPWMGMSLIDRGFWASDFNKVDYNHIYLGTFLMHTAKFSNEIWVLGTESHELFYNLDRIQCMTIRCVRKDQQP